MSVLITGAGLIGVQIARLEQEAGRTPVLFDFAPRSDALADFIDLDRCVVIRGDVTNPLDLLAAVRGNDIDRIIHTAAFGGLTSGSVHAPYTSTQVNVMGTANVLEIARVLGIEHVVISSSNVVAVSVVGGADEGRHGYEEAYPRPATIYAANKQAVEGMMSAYREHYGLDAVAVRYAAVFGPWRPGGGGAPTRTWEGYLRSALAGEPVEITMGGIDLVYSKDAAQGTWRACWAESLQSHVFNLTMGETVDAEAAAAAINAAIPGNLAKAGAAAVDPPGRAHSAARPAIPIERARQQLGYDVKFPMDVAIRDYVAWLKEHPTSSQDYGR